ncbi:6047_t:CDS:2, partial [Paraglomus occultum]
MNPLRNKFLGLFVILVVMLATLTASNPIPELEKREDPVMNVPSPGPGQRKMNSIQNVSWWCNKCSSKAKVDVKITNARDANFATFTGHNAKSGSLSFVIDPKWARVGFLYLVQVTLHGHPEVSGFSSSFEV